MLICVTGGYRASTSSPVASTSASPALKVVSARAHAHVASTSASPATKLCQHVPMRMLHPLLRALAPSCVSTCPCVCCIHFCEPYPPSCGSTYPCASLNTLLRALPTKFCQHVPMSMLHPLLQALPPSCVSTCPGACCIHFCKPCHQVVLARAQVHVASTSASPATKLC